MKGSIKRRSGNEEEDEEEVEKESFVLFDISHQVRSHNKPPRRTATEEPCNQGGSVGA